MGVNGERETEVIVLGGIFPKGMEKEVLEKSSATLPFAANAHLGSIIKGLDENLRKPVKIFNVLPVGSFPKRYRDLFIKEFEFSHTKGADDINIGYCNLTLLKKWFCERAVLRHIKKELKQGTDKGRVLIIYSVLPMYLKAAKIFRKYSENNKVCLIVPDLPEYTDIDKEGKILFDIIRKLRIRRIKKYQSEVDCFVYLAEAMKDYFEGERPYIVMEGISNPKEYNELLKTEFKNPKLFEGVFEKGIKSIAYTGSFTKKYGILKLLKAFELIENPNYRLILCGAGEAEKEVTEAAKRDKRIIYTGAVTRDEAVKIQSKATILVNPRTADGDYTKYSFPSKIIEYMMSGRPVLCFRLPAFPEEYDGYLNYFDSENINDMAKDIIRLCECDEESLKEMGTRGRNFVVENKNNVAQAEKILALVKH